MKDATAGRDGPPWLVRWMPFTDSMQLAGRPSATAGQPGSLEMIVRSRRGSQSVVGTPVANARRAAALRVCLGSAWWLSCRAVHGDLRTAADRRPPGRRHVVLVERPSDHAAVRGLMRQAPKPAQLRAGEGTLADPVKASSSPVTPRSSCSGVGGRQPGAGDRCHLLVRRHAACDQPAAITAAPATSSVPRRR